MEMKRVAVFCGSNVGDSPVYREAAAGLGRALAENGLGVVFGGTNKGLMAALAESAKAHGGHVHGVITRGLVDRGQACTVSDMLETVETRAERKARMADLADAFVALPGGIGTLEELFEVWVNAQFEGHTKPMALLDTQGYYQPLVRLVESMIERAFLPAAQRDMIIVEEDPRRLVDGLSAFRPVVSSKWLDGDEKREGAEAPSVR